MEFLKMQHLILLIKKAVKITLYDMLGREVMTLVNEVKPVGNYGVNFHAGNLASGVYFYRMRAGNFIQAKKMILMK